jgi:hypothetical protein
VHGLTTPTKNKIGSERVPQSLMCGKSNFLTHPYILFRLFSVDLITCFFRENYHAKMKKASTYKSSNIYILIYKWSGDMFVELTKKVHSNQGGHQQMAEMGGCSKTQP